MKTYFNLIVLTLLSFQLLSQEFPSLKSQNRANNNYFTIKYKVVDFKSSLHIKDYKTSEFQLENGFDYHLNRLIDISFGINGGVILGIPYENRLQAYFNSGNVSGLDTFLNYYDEIDFIDQSLAKTRYFIGLKPQLGFNITEKWKILAGTELRYFFQHFFERRTFDGAHVIDEGVNFNLLGTIGLNYLLNEQLSIGFNYDRGLSYLRRILIINSGGNGPFESVVRYHSLGLNLKYCF